MLASLATVAAWLDAFDPSSLLELDYGGVAALFHRDELYGDTTCEDLWDAIGALESGDLMAAAAGYALVRSRWSARWAQQHAN